MAITQDVFRTELDGYLKRIGGDLLKKKNRNNMIGNIIFRFGQDEYDHILEHYRKEAIEAEEERKRKDAKRIKLEAEEQKMFVAWFKETYPDTDIMLIRNDGTRTPAERTDQLLMGLLPGASDLFIPDWLCWIEMKRSVASLSTWDEKQQAFAERRRNAGQKYLLCHGFEDAKRQVLEVINEKAN